MKQLIIARKDLQMSPGKLAAQVSHASMAFLTTALRAQGKEVCDCQRGRAWSLRHIGQSESSISFYKTRLEEAKKLAEKYYPDSDYVEELAFIDGKWWLKRPQWYLRNELDMWAKQARKRGEEYFYYRPVYSDDPNGKLELCEPTNHVESTICFDMDTWNNWICGSFTKIICEAKNKYQLEKAINMAADLNLVENKDYFLIKDNCLTELTPEEVDENGIGRTLTCIGFRPLPNEIIDKISHKYELYK